MKNLTILFAFLSLYVSPGNQKTLNQGIVYSNVEIRTGSFTGTVISETESRALLNNEQLKVVSVANLVETSVLIDKNDNKAITYMQLLGKKFGFTSQVRLRGAVDTLEVVLEDSSKTINGFDCKLARIYYRKTNDKRREAKVWYCPDFKFTDSTMGVNISGIDRIPGFPIQIRTVLPPSLCLSYSVLKIDASPAFAKNDFLLPKDVVLYNSVEEFQRRALQVQRGEN